MKKNFFKKLSFVLALAMIISTIAPAAIGYAASAPKLNATTKYLHLDVDGKDNYNFNVSGKKSGWVYSWDTSDEDVAVVDERGVATATGVGAAQITCLITDKKGVEQATLTATVKVRDNIKSLTITGTPADNKLAIGKANTFTYTYTTNANKTSGSSSVVTWKVEPADGATITDKGEFVATKAGKYTVKAFAYQSADRAKAADANYLTATATYDVTVAASMVSAKQADEDTVNVTFDAAMTDVAKNLTVTQLVGTTKVNVLVKEVKMDAANKVAAVTTYVAFNPSTTYVVSYTGMNDVSFVAATKKVEDVKSISIATTTAVVGKEKAIDVRLFNAENCDITTPELSAHVTLKSNNEVGTYVNTASKTALIFTKGLTTTVTATFHTYKYNTSGVEEGNLETVGIITGVDADATNVTGLNAWTMVKSGPNFGDVKQNIAAGDSGYKLYVQFNTANATTGNSTVDNTAGDAGKFEFTSSDETVLIVDKSTGLLFPVKEGASVVVVKYGEVGSTSKTPIGAITVTVKAKRAATNLTLDKYNLSLSNDGDVLDSQSVNLTLVDQLGDKFPFGGFDVKKLSGPSTGNTNLLSAPEGTVAAPNDGTGKVTFYGAGRTEGTYTYQLTASNVIRVVTIVVNKASADSATYWRIELGAQSVDLVSKDSDITKDMTVHVFGYSSNGVKVTDETIGTTFKVNVDAPMASDYSQKYDKAVGADNKYALVTATSGSVIDKVPVGSFKVTATRLVDGVDVPVDVVYFTTSDSQVKPVFSKVVTQIFNQTIADPTDADDVNLIAAAKACFEVKLNGGVVTSNIIAVDATGTSNSIFVKSVTVQQAIKLTSTTYAYINHKVDINTLIQK